MIDHHRDNTKPYKSWEINDLALLIYAKNWKGLTYPELAELMGVTVGSINGQVQKLAYPERYSPALQEKANKAEVLAFAVKSGQYPDHRAKWDKQISEVTGIEYQYNGVEEEDDFEEMMEEVFDRKPISASGSAYSPSDTALEEDCEEDVENSGENLPENLISFSINTRAVLAVIKALKG